MDEFTNERERRRRECLVGKVRLAIAKDSYLDLFDDEERALVKAAQRGDAPLESIPLPRVASEDEANVVIDCLAEIMGMRFLWPAESKLLGAAIAYVSLYSNLPALPASPLTRTHTRFDVLVNLVGKGSDDRGETKFLEELALQVSTGLRASEVQDGEGFELSASDLRRVDTGEMPAKVLKPDGTHGFSAGNDLFLSEYEEYKALKDVYGDMAAARTCKAGLSRLLPLASQSVRADYHSRAEEKRMTVEQRAKKAHDKVKLAVHMDAPVNLLEGAIVDGLYAYIQDRNVSVAGKLTAINELERRANEVEERRRRADADMFAAVDLDEPDLILGEELE